MDESVWTASFDNATERLMRRADYMQYSGVQISLKITVAIFRINEYLDLIKAARRVYQYSLVVRERLIKNS